ncbi:MAG: glycosyltransferase family 2 protein [Bacteroidales bacterium]|jgi:glycosyltransferase involved in cell wall biosynthesis|nr:glycosyltransferase family 2 protein [Bacteroidales bacterium]
MKWYTKYLSAFGDFSNISDDIFRKIHDNLRKLEREQVDASVVVIAYNEEGNILPCIWSLSEMQTDLSVEIIVVNNASTDRTQEILDRMGVRNVFQPKPGHGHARQAGLEIARGKYHFTADSDTLYPPTYIDTMIKYLSKPNVSAVFTPCGFYVGNGKKQGLLKIYEFFRDKIFWLRSYKRPEYCVGGATFAFYTEHAKEIGWRTHILRGEDGAMLTELKRFGKPVLVLSQKARVKTSSRRLYKDGDGSLLRMMWRHVYKDIKRIPRFFTKHAYYEDQPYNLRDDKQ